MKNPLYDIGITLVRSDYPEGVTESEISSVFGLEAIYSARRDGDFSISKVIYSASEKYILIGEISFLKERSEEDTIENRNNSLKYFLITNNLLKKEDNSKLEQLVFDF